MTEEYIDAETEHFKITIKKMNNDPSDGSLRAVIEANHKNKEDIPAYDQEIKYTGHSVNRFASDVVEINGEQDNDDLKSELKTEILKHKQKTQELAEKRQERLQNQVSNFNETEPDDQLEEVLADIYRNDGPITLEDISEQHSNIRTLVDNNQELIIRNGQQLLLTEKGQQQAEEILGFDQFEGNVNQEAEKQLKDDPLDYYLTAFNKTHKGDHLLKIWELVSALSSTLSERKIHSWAVGASGSGKSHIKRQLVEHLLPEEMYRKMNSVSPKALLYETEKQGPDVLNNQLVFFDEVDDLEEVVTLLRSITDQDEDRIDHTMVRDQEAYTLSLNVDNITVWFTSVETINDEQLKNRFILTNPDGSSDLDEKVFNHQLENLHIGSSPDSEPTEAPVVREMVKQIRKDTEGLTPIIPFKVNWKQKFNRRLYPYFVTLMGTLAKIHYKNRVVKNGNIYVTQSDFELASLIWDRIIDTTVAQTDDESLRLLEKLPDNRGKAVTSAELQMRMNGFSTNKVRDKIEALQETEELNLVNSDMESGQYIYWAGEDREKLVDNVPEIVINRDIAEDMLTKAGVDADEEIIDNITGIEIPVYEDLVQRFESYQERMQAKRDNDELDIEITGPEKLFIKQAEEFEWSTDLTHIEQMSEELDNVIQIATELEDKGVISIQEDDSGSLVPKPTPKYDQAKQEDVL